MHLLLFLLLFYIKFLYNDDDAADLGCLFFSRVHKLVCCFDGRLLSVQE